MPSCHNQVQTDAVNQAETEIEAERRSHIIATAPYHSSSSRSKQRIVERMSITLAMQVPTAPLAGSRCAARKTDRWQPAHGTESRRHLGLQLLTAAAIALAPPRPALAAAPSLTPYQRGLQLEYGLTSEGRIPTCPSDANPNCVSTSSTNAVRRRRRLG